MYAPNLFCDIFKLKEGFFYTDTKQSISERGVLTEPNYDPAALLNTAIYKLVHPISRKRQVIFRFREHLSRLVRALRQQLLKP